MASDNTYSVAAVLSSNAAAAAASSFELQFNILQNQVIRRLNTEIEKANEIPRSEERRLEGLEKDRKELTESLPVIQQYRVGIQNTQSMIDKFRTQIAALIDTLGPDDTVDEDEVNAFTTQLEEAKETLKNVYVITHPDVEDGDVILRLKDELETLEGLTPVVGTKEDNADITSSLVDLDTKVGVAQETMTNLLVLALNLEQDVNTELVGIDSEITETNVVEQSKKIEEVENLKARYGQILQALSLSFEINQELISGLNQYLQPQVPEPGSVLNMFT